LRQGDQNGVEKALVTFLGVVHADNGPAAGTRPGGMKNLALGRLTPRMARGDPGLVLFLRAARKMMNDCLLTREAAPSHLAGKSRPKTLARSHLNSISA
jgi:hypothetical protein